jgi:hypothetical protein
MDMSAKSILSEELKAINIGIDLFYETLKEQNVEVIQVAWKPRPKLEKEYEDILSKIL